MLRGFQPRLYQETILATASLRNTLVVLPTGLGKTAIALLLAAQRLKQYPGTKMIFVAPTKPLAEQHLRTFIQFMNFPESKFALFTGAVPPKKREELFKTACLIFSTPQGLENDVIGRKVDLSKVSLFVVDEGHRAVGDYSYVFLAKQYQRLAQWPRILALTASPGNDSEKILEVCNNLFIESVEIRTEFDPDVKPYVQPVDLKTVRVELPDELNAVKKLMNSCINGKISELRAVGLKGSLLTKTDLLAAQRQVYAKLSHGKKDFTVLRAMSVLAEVMKAQHALELIETQGVSISLSYFDKLFAQARTSRTKAVRNLCGDVSFKSAYAKLKKLHNDKIEHPKLARVVDFVGSEFERDPKVKIILFTQFRDTAVRIQEELKKLDSVDSEVFVGQAKKGSTGMSQKKQIEMLDLFRDGMFNVLIATSVAEEGLDIPQVDIVAFYEPLPSAIRSIQRRGRTGRQEKGRVVIFLTKGTREEAYSYASKNRERKMVRILEDMRKSINAKLAPKQPTLANFDQQVKIFADYREKGSGVVKELVELGSTVNLEMLRSADYVLSSRVGVELKLVDDFVNSIIDGRLLEQLKTLKKSFDRPVIIVQGGSDIYAVRNVHPNAIRGMLGTIAVSYGIPVLYTRDERDSAALLHLMARREQDSSRKDFSPHADRKPATLKEQQEYIVSALPGIGPGLARELLNHYGSIDAVFSSSEDELKNVKGVGPKIARMIRDVCSCKYC